MDLLQQELVQHTKLVSNDAIEACAHLAEELAKRGAGPAEIIASIRRLKHEIPFPDSATLGG